MSKRAPYLASFAARARLSDPARAERLAAALGRALGRTDRAFDDDLAEDLAHAADSDGALVELVQLAEAHPEQLGALWREPGPRALLASLLGASRAMSAIALRHPDVLATLAAPSLTAPVDLSEPGNATELRAAYYRRLFEIAAADIAAGTPDAMPDVARAMSELVAATLRAALELARAKHPEADCVPVAIIAMGKLGGGELNYISDVDLIPITDTDEASLALATTLVRHTFEICTAPDGPEPPLWPIDTALRPEGKDGPLVKTLAAHRAYYTRWAHTWEFQALLKARPIAGDPELMERYEREIWPLAFGAVERDGFVADTQAMRRRVQASISPREKDRHIKLGPGGLRDVEFTVQLLQLVHGRTDETLRVRSTIDAITALAAGGYIGREAAAELTACYTFERTLEHCIQLHRLRRSHTLPTAPADQVRLSRLLGVSDIAEQWEAVRRRVRTLHEAIFYRPLLPATAQLSADDISLSPTAARERLIGIGYRDPAAAQRHIGALTSGVSRRAAIQRQLLPVLLSWFAAGPDPDGGLLAFRRLSDELGTTHWYLGLLRDESDVALTLAHLLSRSRYIGEHIVAVPTAVTWLAEADRRAARTREELAAEAEAIFARHEDAATRTLLLRRMRQRELLRAAMSDVIEGISTTRQEAITDVAEVIVDYAMRAARDDFAGVHGRQVGGSLAIIAMGRMGGREMSYASDADTVVIYEDMTATDATWLVTRWRSLLADPADAPPLAVDLALRPEGKSGALTRSADSYLDYLAGRCEAWERHALIRARILAAPPALEERLRAGIDAARYRVGGPSQADLRQIRRLKARMETERLPRGVAPARHVKLGPGGLADVEWAIQLIQLRYGADEPDLRTTSTKAAIAAASELGYLSAEEAERLLAAWRMASHIRAGATLALRRSGDAIDVIPADAHDRSLIGGLVGPEVGERDEFDEQWARRARRARAVAEPAMYGEG